MRTPQFDAHRLDVEAFAKAGATLEGTWPAGELSRLMDSVHEDCRASQLPAVRWQATCDYKQTLGGEPQVWLHLRLAARLPLVCQRCLGSVDANVDVDTSMRFVRGEDAAAQLDSDSDADVLALTKSLDLQVLAEDELLLALPLVPRHALCPIGAVREPQQSRDDEEHPFAVLEQLKRGPPSRP